MLLRQGLLLEWGRPRSNRRVGDEFVGKLALRAKGAPTLALLGNRTGGFTFALLPLPKHFLWT